MAFRKFTFNDGHSIEMGVGYLYATLAKDFKPDYSLDDLDEIGYISENAVLTREPTMVQVSSASHGKHISFVSEYNTTFETGIMSYDSELVNKYLTGSKSVTIDDGTVRTYADRNDVPPEIALVFVLADANNGKEERIVMPKAVWHSNYELDFNNEKPITINWGFDLLDTNLADGVYGPFYRDSITKTTVVTEKE